MTDADTIGLDELIRHITEHLAETDAKYRAYVAAQLHLRIEDDDRAIEDISHALHESNGEVIVAIANDCLSNGYVYDGDSLVTVTYGNGAAPAGP